MATCVMCVNSVELGNSEMCVASRDRAMDSWNAFIMKRTLIEVAWKHVVKEWEISYNIFS